jgi:hypothetical protein
MMAADGNMAVDGRKHRSDAKLYRAREYIVGLAGTDTHIARFMLWLPRREGAQPRGDYTAVLLYRDGRITWFADPEMEIAEDHFAIGSGDSYAIAAMDTLDMLGLPVDPRIAVRAACLRDPGSAEPVHYLRWKPAILERKHHGTR